MSTTLQTIAFIGIGTMGRDMAANLLKAGHRVRAFDVKADAVAALASLGATACASVEDAAKEAEVAITMLPYTPYV